MGIDEIINGKREELLRIGARHGVQSVRVFGSVARGEARPDSDVDLLVAIERGRGWTDIGRLLLEWEELLGRRVDLVEPEGLHWFIRDRVLAEAVPL